MNEAEFVKARCINLYCFFDRVCVRRVDEINVYMLVLMIMILWGELCDLEEVFGIRRTSALELRLICQMFSKSKNFLRLSHSWLERKISPQL